MKQSPKFFVCVPVKAYVKRYLEINYGNPVNFKDSPDHERFLLRLLRKPSHRFDGMYSDEMSKFIEEIEILISKDDFMRYGFELSKTNIINFGKYFEDIIKIKARNYIQLKRGFCSLKESIYDFQELFDMPEDYWSFESIKKEIDRNGAKVDMDFKIQLNKFVNQMFLENGAKSKQQIISKRGYRHYLERI